MTDHNSPAGAVGGGQPSGHPAPFGHPAEQSGTQQSPQQQPPQQQQYGQYPGYQQNQPQGQPPQQAPMPSDAARAQVAAAWVRRAPQAAVPPGQAAVPTLPPRSSAGSGKDAKKEKRERVRAERKAEYERKKAAREQRKPGGKPGAATAAAGSAAGTGKSFDVPKAGGRIPSGRRTHVALRATLMIATCALALGSCGVMGLVIGKSGAPQAAALDAAEAEKYRLTRFPTQTAATFAEHYALLCLTYSPQTSENRRKALARFASAGVDADCGWSGDGSQRAVVANWDGTVEKLPEYGEHGRYLGIQVRLSDGRLTTLSVPVYVKDLTHGEGMRIAGNVGEMPLPARGSAPPVDEDDQVVDDVLSAQLQKKVLPGYFEAWGRSDATAMTRFTTPDATSAATSGLQSALAEPQVNEVQALAPEGSDDGDTISYRTDQAVQARVTVDWTDADGGTVRRAYRMTVVNTEQGWFIKDIRGGVLDPEGGAADAGEATPAPEESAGSGDTAETEPSTEPTSKKGKESAGGKKRAGKDD
ncbi:conjugal transfer protein [Streptomyces purpurogeneiscleroticus]|uniref:conjugal transfer protein n=1 Tax=Streptomyces purpurogeneiscleroticus TaxID=68259 RepID=UPI001CBA7021|nr:conjugal transfer protein [Streptomyces purpurogeneiscleroticus]